MSYQKVGPVHRDDASDKAGASRISTSNRRVRSTDSQRWNRFLVSSTSRGYSDSSILKAPPSSSNQCLPGPVLPCSYLHRKRTALCLVTVEISGLRQAVNHSSICLLLCPRIAFRCFFIPGWQAQFCSNHFDSRTRVPSFKQIDIFPFLIWKVLL